MRTGVLLCAVVLIGGCQEPTVVIEDETPDIIVEHFYFTEEDTTPDIVIVEDTTPDVIVLEDNTPDVVQEFYSDAASLPVFVLEDGGGPPMPKKFSDLTAATALANADLFAITQSGTSKKITSQEMTPTETLRGMAEVATDAETLTGTDDARMVTPLKLKTLLDRQHGAIRKDADETVNGSAALQDDDELIVPIAAGDELVLTYTLFIQSNNTADFKLRFVTPDALPKRWSYRHFNKTANTFVEAGYIDAANALTLAFASGQTEAVLEISLSVDNGAGAAGNVELEWAQGTSTAVDTKVLAHSSVVWHRVN